MKKDRPQQKVRAQITVTLFDDGTFNVNGPLHDKLICYGLIGLAQRALGEHSATQGAQAQAAAQVKGSKPWWQRIFKGAGEKVLAQREAASNESAAAPEALKLVH